MSGDEQACEGIIMAQSGDRDIREQLIAEYLPFIRRTVRHLTHTVFVEQLDEYSIALAAFNEAIDRYDATGQVPFEPYARILIKHRLTDWYRRQKNASQTLSLSSQIPENSLSLGEQLADPKSEDVQANLEFQESMLCLQAQLEHLGFTLNDLVTRFPKHRDTRLLCLRLARCLSSENSLFERLLQSGQLPGKDLSRRCNVPVKTIERNRPAIILLALLLKSDLQTIQTYIKRFERED